MVRQHPSAKRSRPWQTGQTPVGRPLPSKVSLPGIAGSPVPGQLPSGTATSFRLALLHPVPPQDRPSMCGWFTSSQRREIIGERFQVSVPEGYSERFDLAPTQKALIVREREGGREALMARWGLLPHWAKDERISYKLIDARAETLLEKPSIPVTGRQVPLPCRGGRLLRVAGRPGRQEAPDPLPARRRQRLRVRGSVDVQDQRPW